MSLTSDELMSAADAEKLYTDDRDAWVAGPSIEGLQKLEQTVLNLGRIYQKDQNGVKLSELIINVRDTLAEKAKSKAIKLVRLLIEIFQTIPGTVELQVKVTDDCIEWARRKRVVHFRHWLEIRFIAQYMKRAAHYSPFGFITKLLKELKKLDDKLSLVEVQLLQSRAFHFVRYIPQAHASLTAARTSAASVFVPPHLQADLDLQSGMLHSEDREYGTAFSYFREAFEGYCSLKDSLNGKRLATASLQYMLLAKIMGDSAKEVKNILNSKLATDFSDPRLSAMSALAQACVNKSLSEYNEVLAQYRDVIKSDQFVLQRIQELYDSMLEQNVIKVIEPFTQVEVYHIAKLVGLDEQPVEQKLSQMILDKLISGVLDQGTRCLILFEKTVRDKAYDSGVETVEKLINVADLLYANQASQLL